MVAYCRSFLYDLHSRRSKWCLYYGWLIWSSNWVRYFSLIQHDRKSLNGLRCRIKSIMISCTCEYVCFDSEHHCNTHSLSSCIWQWIKSIYLWVVNLAVFRFVVCDRCLCLFVYISREVEYTWLHPSSRYCYSCCQPFTRFLSFVAYSMIATRALYGCILANSSSQFVSLASRLRNWRV